MRWWRGISLRRLVRPVREAAGQAPDWPNAGARSIVEALREPALIVDRELVLRYRNAESEKAFGALTLGDPIVLRFRAPEILAALEEAWTTLKPGTTSLSERRPLDRFWTVEIMPVPPLQGDRPSFLMILFHDRTAERRVERMRTDFVANASHELRTPLASLIGFIETLQGPAKEDPAARTQFLEIMREQAARMSRLTDDLLSLSRIEMKRQIPASGRVDLKAILAEVSEQMAPLAQELGLSLEFDPPAGPFMVTGERDELVQVFSNLIENACKYGESGKRVVLRLARGVERDQPFVDASVEDFGPGIAPEHVPRLTERFYRVDSGSSRSKRGTGLGLSIVRNILLRHKARLIIRSEPGKGSVFTARFPALPDNARPAEI